MIFHAHHYASENVLKLEGVKDLPPEVIDACPQHLLPSCRSRQSLSSFRFERQEMAFGSKKKFLGAFWKCLRIIGRSRWCSLVQKKPFQDETTIRYASQRNEDPPNATHTKTQKQKIRLFMFRALNDGAVIAFLMIFRSRLQRRNTSLAAAFFRVCVSSEHTKIISVDLFFVHQHFSSVKMCIIARGWGRRPGKKLINLIPSVWQKKNFTIF